MVGSQVSPVMAHFATISSDLVAVTPPFPTIGTKVLSIMVDILTILPEVFSILLKLFGTGAVPFILPELLAVSMVINV
jgi:hypothetical protein